MTGVLLYAVAAPVVLLFSALLSMAGLGAAFIFVPFFLALGVPVGGATAIGLLMNFVSLSFASVVYIRTKVVDFRTAIPIAVTAVLFAPLGAQATHLVDQSMFLWMFAGFLVFAGTMMLFYKPVVRTVRRGAAVVGLGGTVGAMAGFLGGLLGVGGGNFIMPVLNFLGFDAKVAAGTTAFVVVFSSLAGFFGHATLGELDYVFVAVMAVAAVAGALLGSYLMRYRVSSAQLKKIIGVLLFGIAARIVWQLVVG